MAGRMVIVCASCIFVFAPDGKICICSFNSPGCWHDSTQANHGGVYDKIEAVCNATGRKAVIVSAFSLGNRGHFIKSNQSHHADPFDAQELLTNQDATSVRQLSEWGMRQIQAKFPCLKDDMPCEEHQGERKITLNLMILLHSFQTARVGQNQILNMCSNTLLMLSPLQTCNETVCGIQELQN
jgi:hypothetical protein